MQPEIDLSAAQLSFQITVAGVQEYAVFLLDRKGYIRSWNAGAQRIKGYLAAEILGKHFSVFYPDEAIQAGLPDQELVVAAQDGWFEDEGWRLRKDGSRFWANVVITAVRNESGELAGFLKITRDLTDRRRQEKRLRESEERFRLMVECVRDYAIFMLDIDGHVATWNAGAERIKGYTADEIIGHHFSDFYTEEKKAAGLPEHELKVAAEVGRFEDEGWRVRKDGSMFWANVVITALRDQTGKLRGFAKVTRDLTERMKAELRTREVLQEEAARKAAESSSRDAKLAQENEQRQREQLQVTLSSIGDAVIVTDETGRVTFMNPVAVELTGWDFKDAETQQLDRVFKIINQQTRQPVESPVNKVLREGTIVGLANHTLLINRRGKEIPIDDSGAPIRGPDGKIRGVVLVFRDVSESHRAAETRLHLAAIVESSDDAIISKTLDGKITSWNKGAERLFGYTADEMIGQPLSKLLPPDHPNELPSILDQIKQGKRIEHFETVRVRKDGSRVDVSLVISPVRNFLGTIVGASKIARDITARKRQEAALRFLANSSKLLGELLDVPSTLQKIASLAVPQFARWCVIDLVEPNGSIQRVAIAHQDPAKLQAAQELYRKYPTRVENRFGPAQVIRSGKPELVPEITSEMLAASTHDENHFNMLRGLKSRSYMSVPLTSRGTVLGAITFVSAKSGPRYDELDLQLAQELAQRASSALENARLYAALKDAGRRKDEFLAMLAHELRNPLAPIRNALQIMKMPGANREALERARQMTERQVQQLVRLVDDLLDVSRIMRGKIELRKEPVDLSTVITRAVETVQPILDAQGQELVVSVPDKPMRLDADIARLTQIIGNLLNNAAKFSQRAGRVWLTVERCENEAIIQVRDQGAGIPADLLPHVFDLFVQGDRSLERSRGGLGIGLTVVHKLVGLHGGSVSVRSDGPGRGAEFTVRLPCLKPGQSADPTPSAAALSPKVPSKRILVVDDNVDAAESVAMLLRMWGHDVHLAHNGPEALHAADKHHPEAIVLDIGLPVMNGYEVARRLREQPKFQSALLVAVTGYGQEEDRRRSVEAGFDHHLTKPVDPYKLQTLLLR